VCNAHRLDAGHSSALGALNKHHTHTQAEGRRDRRSGKGGRSQQEGGKRRKKGPEHSRRGGKRRKKVKIRGHLEGRQHKREEIKPVTVDNGAKIMNSAFRNSDYQLERVKTRKVINKITKSTQCIFFLPQERKKSVFSTNFFH